MAAGLYGCHGITQENQAMPMAADDIIRLIKEGIAGSLAAWLAARETG